MRSRKLTLPALILAAAIVAMAVYGVVTNIAKQPTIPQHDFPFSITYELDGKIETFEGIYSVSYVGNGGYIDATIRQYEGTFISNREDANTGLILRENKDGTIYLHTRLYPDYLMGDPEYDSYFDTYPYAPVLTYSNFELGDFEDEQTLAEQGARLISWEYPDPIVNSFKFSHIAHLNGNVVIPFVIIAAVALLAVLIVVKKDSLVPKHRLDKVSILLNVLLAVCFVPFTTIIGWLSDINGSSGNFLHQLFYLVPAITTLGLAASVSLRRKGFIKGCFIVSLIGPGIFMLMMLFSAFFE